MSANGFFRTRMDNGSIVFVIWARNSIGVAWISDGRRFGLSCNLRQRLTRGGFDTWSMNVRAIENVRGS